MVLISTRLGLVACRALVPAYYENRWTTAPEIAKKYNINLRTLLPVLRSITRAGILNSRVGGVSPGFMFARDPKDISLFDILSVLEDLNAIPCCQEIIPGLTCDCNDESTCSLYTLAKDLSDGIKRQLTRTSIADIARNDRKKNKLLDLATDQKIL